VNGYGSFEGGAAVRRRTTSDFDRLPPASGFNVDYVRASGLAQVRLQLAVLSGNRRGALRELDRLVEFDKRLEAGHAFDAWQSSAGLKGHLDEQREAIACEKLALMAAIEFPRLAPAERSTDPVPDEDELAVVEDTEFGRKLLYALAGVLTVIAIGTALALGLPLIATL
jgi:hypothetical protein